MPTLTPTESKKMGDLKEAMKAARAMLQHDPEDPKVQWAAGVFEDENGKTRGGGNIWTELCKEDRIPTLPTKFDISEFCGGDDNFKAVNVKKLVQAVKKAGLGKVFENRWNVATSNKKSSTAKKEAAKKGTDNATDHVDALTSANPTSPSAKNPVTVIDLIAMKKLDIVDTTDSPTKKFKLLDNLEKQANLREQAKGSEQLALKNTEAHMATTAALGENQTGHLAFLKETNEEHAKLAKESEEVLFGSTPKKPAFKTAQVEKESDEEVVEGGSDDEDIDLDDLELIQSDEWAEEKKAFFKKFTLTDTEQVEQDLCWKNRLGGRNYNRNAKVIIWDDENAVWTSGKPEVLGSDALVANGYAQEGKKWLINSGDYTELGPLKKKVVYYGTEKWLDLGSDLSDLFLEFKANVVWN